MHFYPTAYILIAHMKFNLISDSTHPDSIHNEKRIFPIAQDEKYIIPIMYTSMPSLPFCPARFVAYVTIMYVAVCYREKGHIGRSFPLVHILIRRCMLSGNVFVRTQKRKQKPLDYIYNKLEINENVNAAGIYFLR